jgi:hypothetical protein
MDAMRQSWTDNRLDEFSAQTVRRFDDLERRMDIGFNRIDGDMRAVRNEIGALQRTMIQVGGGMIVAVLGLIATQL